MSKWKIDWSHYDRIVTDCGVFIANCSCEKQLADQIVREHNAHEELVKACELSKEVFENIRKGNNYISDTLLCLENLESALQKAKGNE